MQIKQNGAWVNPPANIQWRLDNQWNRVSVIPDEYVMATDSDFRGTSNGSFMYIGSDEYVLIPSVIKGVNVTSYAYMFDDTSVKGVASTNKNVTDMEAMFAYTTAPSLDLRYLETSGVTNMTQMFNESGVKSLDVSTFNTKNVTTMLGMFTNSFFEYLDLRSFDTSNVTNMFSMFEYTMATTIDLSSFVISNVTDISFMFSDLADGMAATVYARTQQDVDRMSNHFSVPSNVNFVVK